MTSNLPSASARLVFLGVERRLARALHIVIALIFAATQSQPAGASGSCIWSVIDHRWTKDESGIWNPTVYRDLMAGLTTAQVGAALWEGSESSFGKTAWQ